MATALVLCCAVAVTGTSNPCLGDERSEAWKAERSGCKRERAGSTSMEASSSCSCPSVRVKRGVTRCWRTLHPIVDCRLQGLAGCKLWTGERNRTLLRGLCLHPTAPQLTIPSTSVQFLLIAGYSC